MVVVVVLAVLSFLAGLVVLAVTGVGVFRRVKSLGRTVGEAATRIGDATAELDAITPRD